MMRDIGILKVLPPTEMTAAQNLPSLEKRRLFVAGYADFDMQHLMLFRGDGTSLVAPFKLFVPNAKQTPDFHQLEIIDYGTGIALGEYEASTRSVMVELDPEYKAYCDSIRIKDIN